MPFTKSIIWISVAAAALTMLTAYKSDATISIDRGVNEVTPQVPQQPAEVSSPTKLHKISANNREISIFFDQYILNKSKELSIPGSAVVVVRNGRPIFAKAYGYADVASKRVVNLESDLFRSGSASKMFTWLLVMQLVEEGRLDLDTDLNRYLDFKIPNAFGSAITMRHLMTHSAGFPEHFHGLFDRDQSIPFGERVKRNFPERVTAPGSTIAYSNYGAALAGYIVQRMRGLPFERLVEDRIFKPAGMRNSTFAQPVPVSIRSNLVSNYEYGKSEPEEFRTTLAPIGALSSSAADMGRFLAMIANGGDGANGRVLKTNTMREMMALTLPLAPGLPDGMGLGFLTGEFRGVKYAGHAGNIGSTVSADLEILPEYGLAYYYVVNSQGPYSAARHIRDDLLHKVIARFAAPQASIKARGPSTAKALAGNYLSSRRIQSGPLSFSGYLATTPVEANADGTITIDTGTNASRWLPAGKDRFIHDQTGIPLVAIRENGKIVRIASAVLYPAAVFDRAPLLSTLLPFLAAFAVSTIVLTFLVKPFVWAIRRRHRNRARSHLVPISPPPDVRFVQIRRWASVSFKLVILTLVAWLAFGVMIAINFGFLFTMPGALRILLATFAMLNVVFAGVIAWDAILAWQDPQRGWMSRIGLSILAAATVVLSSLYYILDVVDPSTQW